MLTTQRLMVMKDYKYKVNEIFYSLQGEGKWAGRAAVFVRFSICNLRCPFCDTDFSEFDTFSSEEIVNNVRQLSPTCRFVVLTGGEPTLQVDEELIEAFHHYGYYLAMETNGTRPIPSGIDWITCSPKTAYIAGNTAHVRVKEASEVKIVFDGHHEVSTYGIHAPNLYLQPCDVGDKERNRQILEECVAYIERHPEWRLSLQLQKIINIR